MAAEAAAFVAVEEVISTTVQGGVVAGYALAKATLPLKATLSRIATSSGTLSRRGHTISVVDHNAYIFGGHLQDGSLASNEMHIIRLPLKNRTEDVVEGQQWEYKCVPAIGEPIAPDPRTEHTACVSGTKIYIFGGRSTTDVLTEKGVVWVFDVPTLKWSALAPPTGGIGGVYPTLHNHAADFHGASTMIVLGGILPSGDHGTGLWSFDVLTATWRALVTEKSSLGPTPPNMAIAHDRLYTITGSSELHSSLHVLDLSATHLTWETTSFPTQGLTPGPRPRKGAGLCHVALGQGREYLLFFFGEKEDTREESMDDKKAREKDQEIPSQWSDLWAYQLPSDGNTSAKLKDRIRAALPGGIESREGEWAEVEVVANVAGVEEGKAHPGPRAFFAASSVNSDTGGYGVKLGEKADKVVLWAGVDPNGDVNGDGWEIALSL